MSQERQLTEVNEAQKRRAADLQNRIWTNELINLSRHADALQRIYADAFSKQARIDGITQYLVSNNFVNSTPKNAQKILDQLYERNANLYRIDKTVK